VRTALAFASTLLALAWSARVARADDEMRRTTIELPRLALAGYDWLNAKPFGSTIVQPDKMTEGRLDPAHAPTLGDRFGIALVARDWSVTHPLTGDDAIVDRLRLSRSTRMAVTRMRLKGGVLSPYAQLGLGQWRVDSDILPQLPHDNELAAQMGAGIEWRIFPRAALACETDQTVLYREHREPQNIPSAHLYSALVAFRAEF
jgi:hypothetical protein